MKHWYDKLNEPHRLTDAHLRRALLVCIVALVVLMAFALSAEAQGRPLKAAIASYAVTSVIDARQTGSCLAAGTCREINPALKGFTPGRLVAVKLAANSATAYGIWTLRKRHPKTALGLAIAAAGFQGVVVMQNAQQTRRRRGL